ncbi:3'5'-cyclic nucleotide phosphodiesterase, partial [Gilliamella apicola SCGC AB-598-I20]
ESHQCKKSNGNNESWALAQLCSSKILSNAWFQIERNNEFYLVSPLSCKIISDLSDSALNSNGNPEDFLKWQINASKERKKIFEKLCNYLNLVITCLIDVSRAINFLKKFKIEQFNDTKTSEELLQSTISLLYSADAANILRFLKIYPVDKDKLRTEITPFLLQGDLEKSGFNRRVMPSDTRIKTAIDNLSEEFNNSICSSPVANLINIKNEVLQLFDSIQSNAVTLLTVEAGFDKSFLLLQLLEFFQQQVII